MAFSISGVSIRRGQNRILSNISFSIDPGRLVAITGVNGSGKSTLLGALSSELPLESGQLSLDGVPLLDWSLKDLARRRAVLRQDSQLTFPFNVLDVVLMGRSAHHQGIETARDIEIAQAALDRVNLSTFSGRKYTQLSGGERQRVHLARVLAQLWQSDSENSGQPAQPGYLLLDEPTASQDMAAQHRVLSCARDFADRGGAVVCVLHDLNQAAQYADMVVLLHEGGIAAMGTPREVFKSDILEPVYGVPIQLLDHEHLEHPVIVSLRDKRAD